MQNDKSIADLNEILNLSELQVEEYRRLRIMIGQIGLFLLFTIVSTIVNNPSTRENKLELLIEASKLAWTMAGGSYLMSFILHAPAEGFMSLLAPLAPRLFRTRDFQLYDQAIESYQKIMPALLQEDRVVIETALLEIRTQAATPAQAFNGSQGRNALKCSLDFVNTVLALNSWHNRIGIQKDREKLRNIILQLEKIFLTHPQVKKQLVPYLKTIFLSDIRGKPHRPRALLCVGASGVGKTTLIHDVFSTIGFNVVSISAAAFIKDRSDNTTYSISYSSGGAPSGSFKISDISPFSRYVYSFSKSSKNSKYTVVILDELDKFFKIDANGVLDLEHTAELFATLLSISEPNTRFWYDEKLGAHLNMQYLIPVLIINKQSIYENPTAQARKTR